MVLPALALQALSAYFSVAICNTERGRKPQNQHSILLLAPMDNDKLFIIASYKHCVSIALASLGNEACKIYANLVGAEPGYVLGKTCRSVCFATTNHARNLGRFGTRLKLWGMFRNAP